MKFFVRLALGASLLFAVPALAQNTIPYEAGTSGLTNGNLVKSGATVGQLQDAGVSAASIATAGSGTTNTVPKFTSGTALGNSAVSDNGTIVSSSESVDVQSNALIREIANAGTTGTTLNTLAKLTGAPSTAVIMATTDTSGKVGIVTGGAGTTGNAQIAVEGIAACLADGNTTAGDYVAISSTNGGFCHDAGATRPTSGDLVGRFMATATVTVGTTTVNVSLFPPGVAGAGGGGGSTVLSAISTAEVDVTSSTTLTNLTGAALSLAAGDTYACHGYIPVNVPTSGGAKVALSTTDTLTVTALSFSASESSNNFGTATALATAVGNSNAFVGGVFLDATVVVSAAGTLQVQVAQNASNATASKFFVDAFISCAQK